MQNRNPLKSSSKKYLGLTCLGASSCNVDLNMFKWWFPRYDYGSMGVLIFIKKGKKGL